MKFSSGVHVSGWVAFIRRCNSLTLGLLVAGLAHVVWKGSMFPCGSYDRCRAHASRRCAPRYRMRVAYALLIALCLLVSGVHSSAQAQSASFRSVDTNSDGVLSFNELISAFGLQGALRILRTIDHNGDMRITVRELRQGPKDNGDDDGPGSGSESGEDDDDDDDDDDGDDGGDDGDDDD